MYWAIPQLCLKTLESAQEALESVATIWNGAGLPLYLFFCLFVSRYDVLIRTLDFTVTHKMVIEIFSLSISSIKFAIWSCDLEIVSLGVYILFLLFCFGHWKSGTLFMKYVFVLLSFRLYSLHLFGLIFLVSVVIWFEYFLWVFFVFSGLIWSDFYGLF